MTRSTDSRRARNSASLTIGARRRPASRPSRRRCFLASSRVEPDTAVISSSALRGTPHPGRGVAGSSPAAATVVALTATPSAAARRAVAVATRRRRRRRGCRPSPACHGAAGWLWRRRWPTAAALAATPRPLAASVVVADVAAVTVAVGVVLPRRRACGGGAATAAAAARTAAFAVLVVAVAVAVASVSSESRRRTSLSSARRFALPVGSPSGVVGLGAARPPASCGCASWPGLVGVGGLEQHAVASDRRRLGRPARSTPRPAVAGLGGRRARSSWRPPSWPAPSWRPPSWPRPSWRPPSWPGCSSTSGCLAVDVPRRLLAASAPAAAGRGLRCGVRLRSAFLAAAFLAGAFFAAAFLAAAFLARAFLAGRCPSPSARGVLGGVSGASSEGWCSGVVSSAMWCCSSVRPEGRTVWRRGPARSGRQVQSRLVAATPSAVRHWLPEVTCRGRRGLDRCHRSGPASRSGDDLLPPCRLASCEPARTSSGRSRLEAGLDRGEYRTRGRRRPRSSTRSGSPTTPVTAVERTLGQPGQQRCAGRRRDRSQREPETTSSGRTAARRAAAPGRSRRAVVALLDLAGRARRRGSRTRAAPSWSSAPPGPTSAARNPRRRRRAPPRRRPRRPPVAGLEQVGQAAAGRLDHVEHVEAVGQGVVELRRGSSAGSTTWASAISRYSASLADPVGAAPA